jgi:hypothetical protein
MSGLINSAGSKSGVIGTTELDYEEGTWTATDGNGNNYTELKTSHYTKIGRVVYVTMDISSTGSTVGTFVTLPFASVNVNGEGNWSFYAGYNTSASEDISGHLNAGNANLNFYVLSASHHLDGRVMLCGFYNVE